MPENSNPTPKTHQTSQQKQDRTDDASKTIQALEKRARDAKTIRLREARLKQEHEAKAAESVAAEQAPEKMTKQKRGPKVK